LAVQWLSYDGLIFAAHRKIEIDLALNLVPCFNPVENPERSGMAEAFVKTSNATTFAQIGPNQPSITIIQAHRLGDYSESMVPPSK
jgi:hypothetical protein